MANRRGDQPSEKHQIPAIDRAVTVLGVLERRPRGATIRDLVRGLGLPRTSVYRIVNSLELHQIVRRSEAGEYTLGPRLLALAARVQAERQSFDFAALAQPFLERLATDLGEASKVSVLDGDCALVITAVSGKREYALAVAVGQRLPLHAGAAGKVLLANLDSSAREFALARPLIAHTSQTRTDRKRLVSELGRIRRQGWAQDQGEFLSSVHAFAAPIFDRAGRVIGALSIPFLSGVEPSRLAQLRMAAVQTAAAIADAIPGPGRAVRRPKPARSSDDR